MPDRLLRAVERGMAAPLAVFGFRAVGGGGTRGETVECTNGDVLIEVTVDYLEGEIWVSVRQRGGPALALEDVLSANSIKALHLSRLPRGVSAGVLEARLRKITDALTRDAPSLLGVVR